MSEHLDGRFSIIGAGVMGEAITSAVLEHGLYEPAQVCLCDVSEERLRYLRERFGVHITSDPARALEGCRTVLLAVKPQDFPAVADATSGMVLPEQLVISIIAGVDLRTLREELGHRAVVRVMPNTPAQVGHGLSVWTATSEVTPERREQARRILAAFGREVFVPDERHIDIATAVSGSGPAFVFLFIEAFIDAAVHIGLKRQEAQDMVLQTVLGSVHLARATGRHPAELRNMVTSPGGTTTEGLLVLERAGLRAAMMEAVLAAFEKTQALGS